MVQPVTEEDVGIRILYDGTKEDPNAVGAVDIVAVHGLAAHPDRTWTKRIKPKSATGVNSYSASEVVSKQQEQVESVRVNWLGDEHMLPSVVPNARIMRYGYQSQWFGVDAMEVRVSDIAMKLLTAVRRERVECPDRPLIFICYCFGGLVVLKALTRASTQDEFEALPRSTTGVMFFGTPFRGAGGLNQADMLAAAASKYSPDQIRGSSLDILRRGNGHLRDITEEFGLLQSKAISRIPVECFFEEKTSEVSFAVGKLHKYEYAVDRDSGCLDLSEGVGRHPVGRNHYDMNKFSSPSEEDFLNVKEVLQKLVMQSPRVLRARRQCT